MGQTAARSVQLDPAMATILMMDGDVGRARNVRARLRDALPSARIRNLTDTNEYRYAVVTERPDVAIVCSGNWPQQRVDSLVWETIALRPSCTIVVLVLDGRTDEWNELGNNVQRLQTIEDLCATCVRIVGGGSDEEFVESDAVREHRMRNRLAGLIAGLHAMASELRGQSANPQQVRQVADEYVARLIEAVHDLKEFTDPEDADKFPPD